MKVLDVKDVKLVPQPEESEYEEGEMVFQRIMSSASCYAFSLIGTVFNIVMSFATIFIWLLYTQYGSHIT